LGLRALLGGDGVWLEASAFAEDNSLECNNLGHDSMRGVPRPTPDKYLPEFRFSDPIFAVWGQKA